MTAEPLASIIVTSYNYDRFLPEAIESALAQTCTRTEVIVVDDGSTDNSREVIDRYGDRILPLLKENGGQGSAFNAGFRASRAPVVLFLDSDDILLPAAVESILPAFEERRVAKVHWRLFTIDEGGARTGGVVPRYDLPEGALREDVLRDGPAATAWPPTSGNAWARWFLAEALPIPEAEYRISPDLYLSVLASARGELRTTREPLGCWRVHGENNTWRGCFEERLQAEVTRWESCFETLHAWSAAISSPHGARGEEIAALHKIQRWRAHSWWHRIRAAVEQIAAIIPARDTFILADEDQWAAGDRVAGRRRLAFPEKEGAYWGLPADGDAAIDELERLRRSGARFIVFAWPAFWWLDHYDQLAAHLRANSHCVLESPDLLIFDLRP